MRRQDYRLSLLYLAYAFATLAALLGLSYLRDVLAAQTTADYSLSHRDVYYLGMAALGLWAVIEPVIASWAHPAVRIITRAVFGVYGLLHTSVYTCTWMTGGLTSVFGGVADTSRIRFLMALVGGYCAGQVVADIVRLVRGNSTRDIFDW